MAVSLQDTSLDTDVRLVDVTSRLIWLHCNSRAFGFDVKAAAATAYAK